MVYAPSKCILYVNRIKKYSFLISFGYICETEYMYVNIVLYSPHKCFLDRNLVRRIVPCSDGFWVSSERFMLYFGILLA